MAELDVKIRQKSVDGIDTLYPKTKAENVSVDEVEGNVALCIANMLDRIGVIEQEIVNLKK